MSREIFLGDGLFASFDGFCVKLRAPRPGGDHFVALDPHVLDKFLSFANKVKRLRDAFYAGDEVTFETLRSELGS